MHDAPEVFSSASDITRLPQLAARLLRELPSSLSLALTLARRDFKVRYLSNVLGSLWAVLSPLAYAAIFVVIRHGMRDQGLAIDVGSGSPALFALIGVVLFQSWLEGLNTQLLVLRSNKNIVQTFQVPPETFFFSALLFSLAGLTFRLIVVLGALLWFRIPLPDTAWLFPLLAIGVVFSASALGLILTPIASLYRDVRDFVQATSLAILFVSPVFYPPTTDSTTALYWLNIANPFAACASTARDSLLGGTFILAWPATLWLSFLVISTATMFVIQRVIFRILAERVG